MTNINRFQVLICYKSYIFVLLPVPGGKLGSVILSDTAFTSLAEHVNDLTLRGVKEMGFTNMTQIQAKAIPALLEGKHMRQFAASDEHGMSRWITTYSLSVNLLN